ncbi:MAG: energy transducer TonB [Burkholderiaceae bacterium]
MLSLLSHALLLNLDFGGQELGFPRFGLPWQDRRIDVPELRVVLVPPRVQASEPATRSVAKPLRSAPIKPPPAPVPVDRPSVSSTQARRLPADAVGEKGDQTAKAFPHRDLTASPADAKATSRVNAPSDAAPAPMPGRTVIAVERSDEAALVVPPSPPEPSPAFAATLGASRPEQLEATRVEAMRLEVGQQEAAQKAARREAAHQEAARQEAAQVEAARLEEAERQEALRLRAAKEERREATQEAAARREVAQQEAARQEAAQVEAARQAAARREVAQTEAARQEAARIEATHLEAERQEAAQQAARREVAQTEAARQEAARVEATQWEAERQEAAQQAARREAAHQEVARQEAVRVEAARLEAERQEAARLQAAKAEEEHRETVRRAAGRQMDAEAAQRAAASNATRQPDRRPYSLSTARRGRLFGRADPNTELVLYAEAMARKIQFSTPYDVVRELEKYPHIDPMVTMAIRSDGSVESVTIVLSSGSPEIDEAVRRIVQSHEHYQAFPPGLARDFDVIEIRRTWTFDGAIRLY